MKLKAVSIENPGVLPYRVRINLSAILDYWKKLAEDVNAPQAEEARHVLKLVDKVPLLKESFDDIQILEKHEKIVKQLIRPLFPEMLQTNEIKAIAIPFQKYFYNPTARLQKIIGQASEPPLGPMQSLSGDEVYRMACTIILNQFYGAGINASRPIYMVIKDDNTGIERCYRTFINGDFLKISTNKKTVKLSKDEIRELLDNFDNYDLWKDKIPPESYDIEGFAIMNLFDVTTDVALNEIKHSLLEKDILREPEQIKQLEKSVQAYFGSTRIELSMGAVDMERNMIMPLTTKSWMCRNAEVERYKKYDAEECFCSNSFEELFGIRNAIVVSDMSEKENIPSPLMQRMKNAGVKSFLIHPIDVKDRFKGFIELTSRDSYVINSTLMQKMRDITPMFDVAFERGVEAFESQVESVIQAEFTRLHPSVSWKFYDVAEQIIQHREKGGAEDPEEVVFNQVVPLYGQFDIRGSSTARNDAIQHDLTVQLSAAESVFDHITSTNKMPVYDQLKYRIQKFRNSLGEGISAGDEIKILDFLKAEIYPVFNHLSGVDKKIKKQIDKYLAGLDGELGVVYDHRKKYEDSVTIINETVQDVIDQHQKRGQEMYPHYFEKYKTDGVEYNLYIGQSISPRIPYNDLYLKNLRLWQLFLTHAVELKLNEIQEDLPEQLRVASLILVHDAPMSIRFRMDEMKFDVDGAYNVRYEIVKKRIDKARIKGTDERITQPGFLTIIYSTDEELSEYRKYIDYFVDLGMFDPNVENHQLEDLQGITGLRAIRMKINYEVPEHQLAEGLEDSLNKILST